MVPCVVVIKDEAARKGCQERRQVWILPPKIHAVKPQICMSNLRVFDSC
jgi:hypothetical protein